MDLAHKKARNLTKNPTKSKKRLQTVLEKSKTFKF